jgi:hypothetical protein
VSPRRLGREATVDAFDGENREHLRIARAAGEPGPVASDALPFHFHDAALGEDDRVLRALAVVEGD